MKISGMDVVQTMGSVRKSLQENPDIPPALRAVVELLLLLVTALMQRVTLGSHNSSIPPSQDPNRAKKTTPDPPADAPPDPGKRKRGGPMKGATMLATLQALGVAPSFSRPAVSNDNSYSESLFKTLKYRPAYPRQAFESLLATRRWVGTFVQWYNHEHRHSTINFVTPAERHNGLDSALLQKRVTVYEAAKSRRPERWSGACERRPRTAEIRLRG